jgi:1-deoxy-D-xylulose-5-phosphate synthase
VRYPKGIGMGALPARELQELPVGKGEVQRQGKSVLLLSFGSLLDEALQAGEQLDATVVNMRFVKPLDTELLLQLVPAHDLVVTLEDNVVAGGAGSAVNEFLAANMSRKTLANLGLPDEFMPHASRSEQLQQAGLDAGSIVYRVSQLIKKDAVDHQAGSAGSGAQIQRI